MILAIDMGNTSIVLGGIDEKRNLFHRTCDYRPGPHRHLNTIHLKTSWKYTTSSYLILKGSILSSVVPPLSFLILSAVEKAIGIHSSVSRLHRMKTDEYSYGQP